MSNDIYSNLYKAPSDILRKKYLEEYLEGKKELLNTKSNLIHF